MTYEEILKEHGQEAAEAFLEQQHQKAVQEQVADFGGLNGDAVHDYLVLKGRQKSNSI